MGFCCRPAANRAGRIALANFQLKQKYVYYGAAIQFLNKRLLLGFHGQYYLTSRATSANRAHFLSEFQSEQLRYFAFFNDSPL